MDERPYITTEVGQRQWDSWSTAPNGSARCHDFWTEVTYREEWTRGPYAGCVYRITERYISPDPEHRGQFVDRTSRPWE